MILKCINNWVPNSGCCSKDATEELFMGVRILEGTSIIAEYRLPYRVWIAGRKLIFHTPQGKHDDTFHLSKFTQTKQEIKDLLYACMNGLYESSMIPAFVEYEVTDGNQQDFLIPIPADGIQQMNPDYYLVFINGLPSSVGDGEFQWELDANGNVHFEVAIEDGSPDETNIVSIYYWYKK